MSSPLILYLIIGIAALLLIVAIYVVRKGSPDHVPNYRAFFVLGIVWLPIGLGAQNPSLWIIGLIFMIIGIMNRSKWKVQPKWSEMPPEQKKMKLTLILIFSLILVLGILAFYVVD